VLGDVLPSSKH